MEWTGSQQIWFLLQSVGLGLMQGFCLDVVTGLAPTTRGKCIIVIDIAFGPMAAWITFFGALIIMDGQVHPLLLFGVFLGMFVEHIFLGRFLHFVLRKVRQKLRGIRTFVTRGIARLSTVRLFGKKSSQKVEK